MAPSTGGPESGGAAARRPRLSLAGRLTALFLALLGLMAALAAAASLLPLSAWAIALALLAVGLPLGAWAIGRALAPLQKVLRGLGDGIASFRDHDFSVRLAYRRGDESGELVRLFNELGEILHEERKTVLQRELLLQTALDRSPASILLVGPLGHVAYANREARQALAAGGVLEGLSFESVLAGCPAAMREMLESRSDGLFTIPGEEQTETYHLAQRVFQLNRRPHRLILLRRLTGELGRQEAETWKNVIRVISHELNNSLAPISSLVHSASVASRDPSRGARAEEIFRTIRERLDHLQAFIEGYAHFARLPAPRKRDVDWTEFLSAFVEQPGLVIRGAIPAVAGWFDPAQMQQVVVNLLKNAAEASEDGEPIELRVESSPESGAFLQVIDRGRGMDEETMRKALLPFYSTKKTGSGLGLPLCREILEAHGGKLALQVNEHGGTTVTCWLPGR